MRGLAIHAGRVAVMVAAALFCIPAAAHAFGIVKSSNGVILQREAGDTTASAHVYIYYDYKGSADTTWTSAWPPTGTNSWRSSVGYTSMLQPGIGDTVELDLVPGWRLQCVYVVAGSTPLGTFAVINEPLDVKVSNPTTSVVVSSMPSVSVAGSVTLDTSTAALPVRPTGDTTGVLVVSAGVVALGVGVALSKAVRGA